MLTNLPKKPFFLPVKDGRKRKHMGVISPKKVVKRLKSWSDKRVFMKSIVEHLGLCLNVGTYHTKFFCGT